jgi:Mn2+/Fe2+ NRAMP family transporter
LNAVNDDEKHLKLLDHAWNHFEYHAQQRLSLFNFYTIFCGLIVAAWASIMTADNPLPAAGVCLGLLLPVVSFVFWRMDQRNAYLTKRSESLMGEAEGKLFERQDLLFCGEEADKHLASPIRPLAKQWSHGTSLRIIFAMVGLIGLSGAIYSATIDRMTEANPANPPASEARR